jgi:hypothetical protein
MRIFVPSIEFRFRERTGGPAIRAQLSHPCADAQTSLPKRRIAALRNAGFLFFDFDYRGPGTRSQPLN